MLKRRVGQRAERKAERYLKSQGLKLVTRNWHCRHGEIDLIMHDEEFLVFVEVRMRSASLFADGASSVDYFKQVKLGQAAAIFLSEQPKWQHHPCRFDVVGLAPESSSFNWVQNAFEVDA
ncbi:MAG: YraN family protein [Pseudomonadota bacterium]